jgi:hypothetical protein
VKAGRQAVLSGHRVAVVLRAGLATVLAALAFVKLLDKAIIGARGISSWAYLAVAGLELVIATMFMCVPSRSCVWSIASAILFAVGFLVTVAFGHSCRCFGVIGDVPRGWHAASAALLVTLSLIVFDTHRQQEGNRV